MIPMLPPGAFMPTPILFDVHDRIATLTLNRPDRLNALIPEMKEGFEEALAKAAEPGVKALFLRGAGRAFCAGGDLGWISAAIAEDRWPELESLLDLGAAVAQGLATIIPWLCHRLGVRSKPEIPLTVPVTYATF